MVMCFRWSALMVIMLNHFFTEQSFLNLYPKIEGLLQVCQTAAILEVNYMDGGHGVTEFELREINFIHRLYVTFLPIMLHGNRKH